MLNISLCLFQVAGANDGSGVIRYENLLVNLSAPIPAGCAPWFHSLAFFRCPRPHIHYYHRCSGEAFRAQYAAMVAKFPVVSIEDPFDQDDW